MDFPAASAVPATIGPWSLQSVGRVMMMAGATVTPASTAWPAASLAILLPIYVEAPCIVRQLGFYVGATPSGNLDMGLYDEQLRRVVSSGAIAAGTASTVQLLNITDTHLRPGIYYLAASVSATTVTNVRHTGRSLELIRMSGMLQVAAQHPLGAGPLTPAQAANLYVPSMFAAFAPTVL